MKGQVQLAVPVLSQNSFCQRLLSSLGQKFAIHSHQGAERMGKLFSFKKNTRFEGVREQGMKNDSWGNQPGTSPQYGLG